MNHDIPQEEIDAEAKKMDALEAPDLKTLAEHVLDALDKQLAGGEKPEWAYAYAFKPDPDVEGGVIAVYALGDREVHEVQLAEIDAVRWHPHPNFERN